MRGEERKGERVIRGGKNCEGFDEDVDDGFVAGEVGVELISILMEDLMVSASIFPMRIE